MKFVEDETTTMAQLRKRIVKEEKKLEKYIDANSILSSGRKSKFVSCKCCGSQLNRSHLKSEKCPVCGKDLRSRTALETIDRYKGNIDKWSKEYKKLDKRHYEQYLKTRPVRYEGFLSDNKYEGYRYLTKDEMISFLKRTKKPFLYTFGLYQDPKTDGRVLTRKEAVAMFKETGMNVAEEDTYIDMNDYGENDLW